MKVFEDFGRINFVDKNNVFVGFCNEGNCCEYFGANLVMDVEKGTIEVK